MGVTTVETLTNQIATKWSPLFAKEFREQTILPSLINKDYEGEIRSEGDTVRVSQINKPTGSLLTVGTDADSFESETMSTSYVDVKADKRAVAAFEITDLAELQSQINKEDSEVRQALLDSIASQVNTYVYSLVSPSTSSPDHLLSGVSDMNSAQISAIRLLAAQAKWRKDKGWWLLLDPSYYSDVLDDTVLNSLDQGATDLPVIGGNVARPRYGFNVLEDNTDGILTLSAASAGADCGLAFHPDFMLMVMQREPTFQLSSLHPTKKFGYLLSVDMVFGCKLGIDGDEKHIQIYNT